MADLTPESASKDIRAALAELPFDPIERERILGVIKKQTKQPLSLLRKLAKDAAPQRLLGLIGPKWIEDIRLNSRGAPVPDAANVLIALRNDPVWRGRIKYDSFRQRPMLLAKPPWANGHWRGPGLFTDADENNVLVWVQNAGIHCGIEAVRQALSILFDENHYHPVRDYIDSLIWDGKPRIANWLTYYLGVTPIENYTDLVGQMWLISGIARIKQPGCMAKYCLILEGEQDLKKSTALETLGGEFYTDDVAELGSKDSAMQTGNAWIVELAELDSIRRAHISAIKAFISRKRDQFRPPYGHHVIDQPRQCILAGTVNPSGEYLTDDTGAARFWPVLCQGIDIDALTKDRDQLWAEARHKYEAGARWWPQNDLTVIAARGEQEARYSADTWEDDIRQWVDGNRGVIKIYVRDILATVFELPKKDHTKPLQTRVGSILKRRMGLIACREGKVRWYERPDLRSNPLL